jgi:hypothetical protein
VLSGEEADAIAALATFEEKNLSTSGTSGNLDRWTKSRGKGQIGDDKALRALKILADFARECIRAGLGIWFQKRNLCGLKSTPDGSLQYRGTANLFMPIADL